MKISKNKLNKSTEQDTPAPYFDDVESKNIKTKKLKNKNSRVSKQVNNSDTPTEYDKVENLEQNTYTPAPINEEKASTKKESKDSKNVNIENGDGQLRTETESENAKKSKKEKRKPKPKKQHAWVWIVKVFALALTLSLSFSILSEMALSHANIALSVIVILVFIAVSIVFDMLGLAVASCPIEPFTAMAARKVAGSKLAISLIKNADKVSAICCDVIGDVCGILAGAGGASILTKIALSSSGFMPIFVASLISAIIAGLTIGGKASFKRLARAKACPITLKFAQVLNLFVHKK